MLLQATSDWTADFYATASKFISATILQHAGLLGLACEKCWLSIAGYACISDQGRHFYKLSKCKMTQATVLDLMQCIVAIWRYRRKQDTSGDSDIATRK